MTSNRSDRPGWGIYGDYWGLTGHWWSCRGYLKVYEKVRKTQNKRTLLFGRLSNLVPSLHWVGSKISLDGKYFYYFPSDSKDTVNRSWAGGSHSTSPWSDWRQTEFESEWVFRQKDGVSVDLVGSLRREITPHPTPVGYHRKHGIWEMLLSTTDSGLRPKLVVREGWYVCEGRVKLRKRTLFIV